jgi:phenylacetic acid degradation operon negative regulatory protein
MRPRTRPWRGDWLVLVVTSVGTDARTRAALRTTMHDKRFGELREGVWMRPDNLDPDLGPNVAARVRVLKARDEAPAALAGELWDLPAWAATGHRLLDEMAAASGIPGRFVVAAAIVRHLLTDPMLPTELLPADWPGARLRAAYHDFATELAQRRDPTQLVEAT